MQTSPQDREESERLSVAGYYRATQARVTVGHILGRRKSDRCCEHDGIRVCEMGGGGGVHVHACACVRTCIHAHTQPHVFFVHTKGQSRKAIVCFSSESD